ncbi:minor capsid protein [Stigmatella aurantiaca]|uniref:Uncharacterized protein n=1 Tax=Stigmatella aurantiaca (strain DW4/3-1) TaxID=378806 RepID=E3FZN7_STIAD|nr:minor capsid protein [Stigmatella aurantiaca]ADO68702.1 uncharacterized protein STAUR_0898 [Stigmatella aurantiaca DW4/3-1]
MSRDTAADLVVLLGSSGLGLSVGGNLFAGPALEDDDATVPDTAAFVFQSGGDPPQSYIGRGRQTLRTTTCQVRIRSAREDFQAGQLLALAALDVLHLAPLPPYVRISVSEGSPSYFGTDSSDRHWWSFTVDAEFVDLGMPGTPVQATTTGAWEVPGNLSVLGSLSAAGVDLIAELAELRARVAKLEAKLAGDEQ